MAYNPNLEAILALAYAEDLGQAGDLTTNSIIDAEATATFTLRARQIGVVSGVAAAARAFTFYDPSLVVNIELGDGTAVEPGSVVATVTGNARSILTAERTALNILGRMSGIATATAMFVALVEGTGACIVDTRKTTPGLRALEKAAVKDGGGKNHRFNLADAVLIKDNHIAVSGGVRQAVERVRENVGHLVKIEVEVDTLEQLDELIDVGADVVLLDNMSPEMLTEAVKRVDGRLICEASGGVNPQTVRSIAESGVDLISIGWLTHSAPNFDIGLDEN